MLLNDKQITELAINGMITPFQVQLIRGVSIHGHESMPGKIRKVNPKNFNPDNLESVKLQHDSWGDYFIIPAHSYGLGVAIERLEMPADLTGICVGKSTYARAGLIANLTPIEASWRGNLTIEISNSSNADCRVYANEGICQLLFLKGEVCQTSYQDRQGKYQNQPEEIVLARI